MREDLLQGNLQYFDDDFNYIELNGRDQFDIGSNNVHPDFGAGPIDVHGTAKVRTYTFDNAFTFIQSGWAGNHTFKAGVGWSQNGVNPIIAGDNDNGTFEFLHNLPFNAGEPLHLPVHLLHSSRADLLRSRRTGAPMRTSRTSGRSTGT